MKLNLNNLSAFALANGNNEKANKRKLKAKKIKTLNFCEKYCLMFLIDFTALIIIRILQYVNTSLQ